jgi:hypothetical protein
MRSGGNATFCGYCGQMLQTEGRARRTWWVLTDDFRVFEAEGIAFGNVISGQWWFPTLRLTMSEHDYLFTSRDAAVDCARRVIGQKIAALSMALAALS